jgi:hypothetical protein
MDDQEVKWRLPEQWTVTRADGAAVRFDLNQDGDVIAGTAHAEGAGEGDQSGIMSGSTTGDAVEMTVYWPAGEVIEYRGAFDAGGTASGTATDRSADSAIVDWQADQAATRWE